MIKTVWLILIATAVCLLVLLWEPLGRVSYAQGRCDPSYPNVCIPPSPPDLDCQDISYRDFRVIGSDPHRLDGDSDGIGCES